MPPYVKQPWVDGTTLADANHMNHIEDGLFAADANATTAIANAAAAAAVAAKAPQKLWDSVDAGVVLPSLSITSAALPQTFSHLLITGTLISEGANNGGDYLRLNGDTGNNYYTNTMQVRGTTVSTSDNTPATSAFLANTGTMLCAFTIEVPYYTLNAAKSYIGRKVFMQSLVAGGTFTDYMGGIWTPGAPVTTVTILSLTTTKYVSGSRITVYGMP